MKKKIYAWLILSLCLFNLYSQEQTTPDYCGEDHFTEADTNYIFEDGYNRYTETFYPNSEEERVRLFFNSISMSGYGDLSIFIFNGEDTFGELLGSYHVRSEQAVSANNIEYISTHNSGALTFDSRFVFGGNASWDAEVFCEQILVCDAPQNIIISETSSSSATIEWDEVENSNEYILEYGESDFELGTGTTITTAENSITISELESVTDYDLYIKTICTDDSETHYSRTSFKTLPDYCSGDHFTDDTTNYILGEENFYWSTETIYPNSENEKIRLSFNTLNIGGYGTFKLFIYDGNDVNEEQLLGEYDIDNQDISTNNEFISTHSTGALTIVARIYFIEVAQLMNWDAEVVCEPKETEPDYCGGDRFTEANANYIQEEGGNRFTETFYPNSEEERVRLFFNSISMSGYGDLSIYIFNGEDTSGELLGEYHILNEEAIFVNDIEFISTHNSGALTFDSRFVFGGNASWDAEVFCEPKPTLSISTLGSLTKESIKLYPQPNNGTFTIENLNNIPIQKFSVCNISGQQIQETYLGINQQSNPTTINNATPGIYFIHLNVGEDIVILKTIIE